jgi:hypothetical protein
MDMIKKISAEYIFTYLEKTINNHLIFFSLIVIFIYFLSNYLIPYNIHIYQLCLFPELYNYLNGNVTTSQVIFSSIISTFVGFFIYKLLYKYLPNVIILGIISFFTLLIMIVTNTLSIASLSYALGAPTLIPMYGNGYIYSYIVSSLIIVIIYNLYSELYNKQIHPFFVNNFKFRLHKY